MKTQKTMTVASANKKLQALGLAKQSNVYKYCLAVAGGATQIRPCYVSGSGRYTQNFDHTKETTAALSLMNISFELSNDAPKGGLTGNMITIKTKIK